ncbi:unnamed protein product [Durusdinium trenchii]|uniref:NAD(P)(+)--arginine ADP-ribosyltransferase n=1 Tax=Durusdinium trenchii TaxID=1381693 RepID=A0ABP0SE88_9DINO
MSGRQESQLVCLGWSLRRQSNYLDIIEKPSVPEDEWAIKCYTSNGYYGELNYALRADDSFLLRKHARLINCLRHCVRSHNERYRVYRGVQLPSSEHEFYQVGKLFLWPGFTSASRSEVTAMAFGSWGGGQGNTVLFKIELGLSSGCTYSRDISHMSNYPSEQEVLLYCYSGFKVTSRKWIGTRLDIGLVPHDTLRALRVEKHSWSRGVAFFQSLKPLQAFRVGPSRSI